MSESIVEKLRNLLAERFKLEREKVELISPALTEKWFIIVRSRRVYDISITAYEDGRVIVDAGPEHTRSEISDYLYSKKYRRRYERARTEEEREKINKEELEEEEGIIEDFRQGRYEKYLKMERSIAYYAKKHMWGTEVAKRISNKYGFETRFDIDYESGFETAFNSAGMDEEQTINEIMKRVDAIADAREMFINEEMMNEFLISKGIEVKKAKRRSR
ncbi:MAG: hypothetical protein FGF48_03025 [Candidatus Brockarchaeota archaeon]|nr:hypothetical protein [Candidatus Brockarchaeota archaeon]